MSEWLLKPNLLDLNAIQTSHRGCQDLMVAYGRVHLCIVLWLATVIGPLQVTTLESKRRTGTRQTKDIHNFKW